MQLRTLILTIVLLAFAAVTSGALEGSKVQTASFKGIVVDAHLARIPKAHVFIEGAGKSWRLQTGADGKSVGEINLALPTGTYKFTIEAPGFKRLVVTDFCIFAGATITYEFRMVVRDCDDCKAVVAPLF